MPITVNATMGAKDIISPKLGKYTMTQTWILDSTTNIPVGVRMDYSFADSTIGRPYDHDPIPYTAGPLQTVALNKPSKLDPI